MADYEVSKLMWITIVVALAASIFVIAQPNIKDLTTNTFDNIGDIVSSTNVPKEETIEDYLIKVSYPNSDMKNGVKGINENGRSNGIINPKLVRLELPDTLNDKPIDSIDFTNNKVSGLGPETWKGVKTIVASSSVKRVTEMTQMYKDWDLETLDLSKSSVTSLGVQYFLQNNTSVKTLILGDHTTEFGYGAFQNSRLETLTINTKESLKDPQYITSAPKGQLTVNAPKELQSQLDPYKGSLKALNYF